MNALNLNTLTADTITSNDIATTTLETNDLTSDTITAIDIDTTTLSADTFTVNDIIINNGDAGTNLASNRPSFFESLSSDGGSMAALTLTTNAGFSQDVVWHVQSCGRICFVGVQSSTVLNVAGGDGIIIANILPANFIPNVERYVETPCGNNGVYITGYVTIKTNGQMFIHSNIARTVGFTNSFTFLDNTFMYSC